MLGSMQIDPMISFQPGFPGNICLESCDTKSEFDEDTRVLPPSRPENEPTKLIWFVVKGRQMIGVSKVCQDALSFKAKSEVENLQLDHEIRRMWTTIRDVLRTRPHLESIADAPFLSS